MSPAFLLLQYYDFHSSHSSYKNARVCMNYAEGLHFIFTAKFQNWQFQNLSKLATLKSAKSGLRLLDALYALCFAS